MITRRPYREPLHPADAIAELRSCAGIQFDPLVVDALVHVLEQHGRPAPGPRRTSAEA